MNTELESILPYILTKTKRVVRRTEKRADGGTREVIEIHLHKKEPLFDKRALDKNPPEVEHEDIDVISGERDPMNFQAAGLVDFIHDKKSNKWFLALIYRDEAAHVLPNTFTIGSGFASAGRDKENPIITAFREGVEDVEVQDEKGEPHTIQTSFDNPAIRIEIHKGEEVNKLNPFSVSLQKGEGGVNLIDIQYPRITVVDDIKKSWIVDKEISSSGNPLNRKVYAVPLEEIIAGKSKIKAMGFHKPSLKRWEEGVNINRNTPPLRAAIEMLRKEKDLILRRLEFSAGIQKGLEARGLRMKGRRTSRRPE